MSTTLFTFGYLTARGSRILSELIAVKTPVVDIRMSPRSKRFEWCQDYLRDIPDINYFWIKDLGNEQYREALDGKFREPDIKLHNESQGIMELDRILAEYKRAAIFCACANKWCHRFVVAALAEEQLHARIVHP